MGYTAPSPLECKGLVVLLIACLGRIIADRVPVVTGTGTRGPEGLVLIPRSKHMINVIYVFEVRIRSNADVFKDVVVGVSRPRLILEMMCILEMIRLHLCLHVESDIPSGPDILPL